MLTKRLKLLLRQPMSSTFQVEKNDVRNLIFSTYQVQVNLIGYDNHSTFKKLLDNKKTNYLFIP